MTERVPEDMLAPLPGETIEEMRQRLAPGPASTLESQITAAHLRGDMSREEYDFQIDSLTMAGDTARRSAERDERRAHRATWLGRLGLGSK